MIMSIYCVITLSLCQYIEPLNSMIIVMIFNIIYAILDLFLLWIIIYNDNVDEIFYAI